MSWEPNDKPKKITHYYEILIGGLTGMLVTTLVHPLDLVKVRMQLSPKNPTTVAMARDILRCEGVSALFNGVTAGLLRQATYTTTRLAVYYWMHEKFKKKYGTIPGLTDKVTIGLYSGTAGALVGNPSEVVLVRMMADGRKDPCGLGDFRHKKLYNGVFHAFYKIIKTEGFFSLWRGGTLTIMRSLCVTIIQIGGYMKARQIVLERQWAKHNESYRLHIYSSIVSGFVTAVLTMPVDTFKTTYQVRMDDLTQKQLLLQMLKEHGILYFWSGFMPYFYRLVIHSTLAYYVLRELTTIVHDNH